MPTTRNCAKKLCDQLVEADPESERRLHQRRREHREKETVEAMADQEPEVIQEEIKLRDRAIPNANDFRSSIAEPQVTVQNFELKPGLIQMVQQSQFGGMQMENPNVHLQKFL